MIKIVCIKKCKPFDDVDGQELNPNEFFYVKEQDDHTWSLCRIYDGISDFDFIGVYETDNFIFLQEWRDERINLILNS